MTPRTWTILARSLDRLSERITPDAFQHKTGEEILRENLHKDFQIALESAIGLLYDGLLTQEESGFILDRALVQDEPERSVALRRLERHGIRPEGA